MRKPPQWTEFPKYPVTAGVLLLCAGATLAWWSGKVDVSPLFANVGIREGQVWRLLTSTLLHGSVLHLGFNLLWWWSFGTLIESRFGSAKFFLLTVFLAAGSSAAEFAILDGGVGLSGVVYGLWGMLYILSKRDERFRREVDAKTSQLFIGWFVLCIVLTYSKMMPVANIAHGAGAVLGILVGLAIARGKLRLVAGAGAIGLFALFVAGAIFLRPWINFSSRAWEEESRRGYELLAAKKDARAEKMLGDAVRMRANDAPTFFNLALAERRLGKNQQALGHYEKAYQLNPADESYKVAYEAMKQSLGAPTTQQ